MSKTASYFVQAVDMAGNVSMTANKGLFFEPTCTKSTCPSSCDSSTFPECLTQRHQGELDASVSLIRLAVAVDTLFLRQLW